MERAEEAHHVAPTEGAMSPPCLNCVDRVNITLWIPSDVWTFINSIEIDGAENEYQLILLRGLKARLEELEGASRKASILKRQIDRMVDDLLDIA